MPPRPRVVLLNEAIEGAHAGFGEPPAVWTSIWSEPSLLRICPLGSASIRVWYEVSFGAFGAFGASGISVSAFELGP